jgi:ABC-type nitrate/sulfonate/bicarbonate transport system substrate-binding protein
MKLSATVPEKRRIMMNVKNTSAVVFAVLLAFLTVGCNKAKDSGNGVPENALRNAESSENYETLEIRQLGWANNVYPFELAEDLGYLAPIKLKYLGASSGGPQALQALQMNQVDLAGTFLTAVVNLIDKGGQVISILGYSGSDEKAHTDFLVLEDSPIKSGRDLIGKKVTLNTFGAANEALVKAYLEKEGLSKEEIAEVEFIVLPASSFEQALRSKQVDGIPLSGFALERALANGGVRTLFNDAEIYGKAIVSVIVTRKDFIEKYPNTTRKLVEASAKAIEWSKANPEEEVRARLIDIVKRRGRDENPEVLQYWHSFGVHSPGGILSDQEVQRWIDWLVGQGELEEGKLKPSDIYTNEFNPYFNQDKSK